MHDAQFWNGLADKYAKQSVGNQSAFDRKIAITKERLTPTSTVLDVGCGTGSLALILAPDCAHVTGVDVSEKMIGHARRKAEAGGVTNAAFRLGAVDESFRAIEDGSLDVAMAYSLLHLVPDRQALLQRMFALLKPGGHLVTSTVCLGNSWAPYSVLLWAMRKVGKAPWVDVVTSGAIEEDLRAAGFVDIQAHDVGANKTTLFCTAKKPG